MVTDYPTTQPDMQNSSTLRAWCVVLTSALFFFYIFIQMSLFNAISSELVKELHFNAKQLSYLFAFYSYGNVLFLFPAGILLDRFSVRKLLLTVFAISIIATYLFATATDFWIMNVARLTLGLAGAFSLLSAIKLASRWFEPRHLSLVVGVVVTMAMVGGAVAQTPLALLTQSFGWRHAMQLVMALGVLLIIAQLMIVRDEPKTLEKLEIAEHLQLKQLGFWHSLAITIGNQQNWLSGIYISLVNLPLFIFGGIWGVPYLTQIHHLSRVEATEVTSMIFIGMMIGSPLAGLISDWMGLRKLPMVIGALLTIAVLLLIMFTPDLSFWMAILGYLFLGVVMGSQVIGYPVIAESNPHTITATATSLGSVLTMSGGMLVPVFGWLLELSHHSNIIDNIVIYAAEDFIRANSLMLVGLMIALIAACCIKETYCKQKTN